jgi:hypothetical protein
MVSPPAPNTGLSSRAVAEFECHGSRFVVCFETANAATLACHDRTQLVTLA